MKRFATVLLLFLLGLQSCFALAAAAEKLSFDINHRVHALMQFREIARICAHQRRSEIFLDHQCYDRTGFAKIASEFATPVL